MYRQRRHPRGVALLSLLMSLMIVGVLAGMYLSGGGGTLAGGKPWHVYQIERTRSAATDMNLHAVNTTFMMAQMDRPGQMNAKDLQQIAQTLPRDSNGGKYFIDDNQVYSTLRIDTPLFRERLGL